MGRKCCLNSLVLPIKSALWERPRPGDIKSRCRVSPWEDTRGVTRSKCHLESSYSSQRTHSGKMTTWPEKLREATGTIRDTTMSSSRGTCNGGAPRWWDVLSMAVRLYWRSSRQGELVGPSTLTWPCPAGPPPWDCPRVPRRNRTTHLENHLFQVLLPRQHLQEVVVELPFSPSCLQ